MSAPVDVLAVMQDAWMNVRGDELLEARAVVVELISAAEVLIATCHGTADFRNGVTDPTGTIDEGAVYGWRAVADLEQKVAKVKGGAA